MQINNFVLSPLTQTEVNSKWRRMVKGCDIGEIFQTEHPIVSSDDKKDQYTFSNL